MRALAVLVAIAVGVGLAGSAAGVGYCVYWWYPAEVAPEGAPTAACAGPSGVAVDSMPRAWWDVWWTAASAWNETFDGDPWIAP